VLASADLAAAQFTDADFEIPYIKAGRLLSRCVAVTGCRHFGLLVGEHAGPSSLGVAGFLLKSAPDVGTALRSLVRHLDLQDQGGMATLQIMGSTVLLGYAIHLHGVEAAEQICELSITIASNIMRSLCGKGWNPAEVHFATRQPRDLAPYRRIFRAPIRFNAGQCAVAFPIRWLDHRIASADALLYQHLEKQAAELHKLHSGDIVDSLCQLLRKSIPARQCTFTDIARQLHLHERTLNRRLQEEGTSFRELLDATRYEMARQLLAESTMPIARIAMTLDYTDASAFSRAFKRWSGTTPAQWRMHNEGSA
ncbi:MAG TPA: AraC family transcriptional regulator, partial [Gammaproteobacteria bacterium]|nr:AraC family transcriptional regulator [Gammaproteobacteria bacterium]